MTSKHQGYSRAHQSILKEESDEEEVNVDLEAGIRPAHERVVSWDKSPAIRRDSDSDDEVPQSLMVEASPRLKHKGKGRASTEPATGIPSNITIPPRPSEVEDGDGSPVSISPEDATSHKGIRLDPYQRALWNWVNVYNLDAFLQDVYVYYEGKGIYSIALSKGFNLLCVSILSVQLLFICMVGPLGLSLVSPHSCLDA
jgi:autophagy-related protein 9